jgi:hypothetical protein
MKTVFNHEESWSQSGNLSVGDRVGGVTCQANRLPPGPYTAQFNIGDVPGGLLLGRKAATAVVKWRLNGNEVSRTIDCMDGTSITGVAEAFHITIRDSSSVAVIPTIKDYVASVQVARGIRAVSERPVLTLTSLLAGPLGEVTIGVPQDVGATSVYVTTGFPMAAVPLPSGNVGDATVIMTNIAGSILRMYDPALYGWVPIVQGTTKLRYMNRNAVNAQQFTAALGIDG